MQPFFFFCFSKKYLNTFFFFSIVSISGVYIHATTQTTKAPLVNNPSPVNQALIWAIQENDLGKVTALLSDRKNINNQDFLGYSPLHYAAKYAKESIVKCLINALNGQAVLDQTSVTNGNTPLFLAIQRGHKKIVLLLLQAGANPNMVNRQGYNGLQLAVRTGRKDLVQLLLQAGATCSCGPSPLLMAIKRCSLPIVACLLKQKHILETRTKKGYTELHWAAKQNIVPIFRALLRSGQFNINAKADNGVTPLHLIAAHKSSKLLNMLLGAPLLEVNVQDTSGNTPLHYAVATNHLKALNGLLRYPSIDVNLQNNLGETALHYAVQCQDVAVVKKLLKRVGKGVLIQNKAGMTPLQLAAMYPNNATIYNLILARINLLSVD